MSNQFAFNLTELSNMVRELEALNRLLGLARGLRDADEIESLTKLRDAKRDEFMQMMLNAPKVIQTEQD